MATLATTRATSARSQNRLARLALATMTGNCAAKRRSRGEVNVDQRRTHERWCHSSGRIVFRPANMKTEPRCAVDRVTRADRRPARASGQLKNSVDLRWPWSMIT